MQLPERNAVSSPASIVGQIRIGRDIHGRDEHEARLPAQEGRGIAQARAAAGAAAMFGRARPAPPPWLCSAGLCGAGSAPPLMSARGGPATCASRPPHGTAAARGGQRPPQIPGAAPTGRQGGMDALAQVNTPNPPPCQQVKGAARLRETGEPATEQLPIVPAPFWSHAC